MEIITPAPDVQRVKQAYSRLAAGTSIITLTDLNGVRMGLTVTAVTSVSAEPPLVLVCINNRSRAIAPLETGCPFVINLLAREQEALAMQFAARDGDKFAGVETGTSATGGLYLTGTLAHIECVPHEIVAAGDHDIVIGRVVNVHLGEESQPLVFFRSRFMDV